MGRIKTLLGIAVGVIIIYAVWTTVPIYLAKFQFEDQLASIAKFSADHNEDQIREEVMKNARDTGVPLQPENVHIIKDSGRVVINTNYTVVVKLPTGKEVTFSFALSSKKT
jgi:predicted membrane protein